MPTYIYQNPQTLETVEVIQGVNEKHEYQKGGIIYNRIFTAPNAAIDTKINPFDAKDFARKTGNKKGNIGDLFDQSMEASEKRKKSVGVDPVKKKYWEDYSKKRGGKRHPKSYED